MGYMRSVFLVIFFASCFFGTFSSSQAAATSITVYAAQAWQSSGVTVQSGDQVSITASGTWVAGTKTFTPEGNSTSVPSNFPGPGLRAYSLIAKIGGNSPLYIGSSKSFTATSSGILYCSMNDDHSILWDNSGTLSVTITLTTNTGGTTDVKMVIIPGGTFKMGQVSIAVPVHSITLSAFEMGVNEITQGQYIAVIGSNPSAFSGDDNLPVEHLTWFDAIKFCNALSTKGGLQPCYNVSSGVCNFTKNGFRLPTEAEWEYACRAGSTTIYNLGDSESDLARAGWYSPNCSNKTHQVGGKIPNAWGLYDMHGNVWEWCNDWLGDYTSENLTNPTGPSTGSYRVVRGGSWTNDANRCQSANRDRENPSNGGYYLGFRVVRNYSLTHSVTKPITPTGNSTTSTNVSNTFSTTGSTCSISGHSVQYQFDWGDGMTSTWSSSTTALHSWSSVGSYTVKAHARCTTDNTIISEWSSTHTVTVTPPHTVSKPNTSTGKASVKVNASETYTASGSTDTISGHSIQYRFDWGGSIYSDWSSSTSVAHSWAIVGTYQVKTQARCTTDISIVSEWSSPFDVTVTNDDSPTDKLAMSAPASASSGSTFWVEVKAQDVTDLFGVSFVLTWDQGSYIDCVKVEQGDFLGSDIIFYPSTDENGNTVSFGISRKSGQANVSGTGVLAKIQFTSKAETPDNTVVAFSLIDISANKSDGGIIQLSAVNGSTRLESGVTVWPGDTNNSGKVDQGDILPLGLYWGKTGPKRPNASNNWIGQPCPKWDPVAATYADANGDGTVNQGDILPIGLNWGKTHAVSKAAALKSTVGGSIKAIPNANLPLEAGSEFLVDINISDVISLYGLSFVLKYDNKNLIEPLSVSKGSILGNEIIFFPQVDAESDNVAVGISQKAGQSGYSGSGTVVTVKFKVTESIEKGTSITFSLNDVSANNSSGEGIELISQPGSTGTVVGVREKSGPTAYSLSANFPNPFNPNTSIQYKLGDDVSVRFEVLNVAGQTVRLLVNDLQNSGQHTIQWDGRDDSGRKVSAGVYLYRLQAGSFMLTNKMLLLQ